MSINVVDAGALLSRTMREPSLPVVPDAEVISKPIHASLITWTMPEIADDEGKVHYLFVISHGEGTFSSHVGSTCAPAPLPVMRRELEQLAGQHRGQTWVCVPNRYSNIARVFAESGFAVTRGINRINRAAREVESQVSEAKNSLVRRARQRNQLRDSPRRDRPENKNACVPREPILWSPEYWSVSEDAPEHLEIGVDASADFDGAGALAMITGHGDTVVYAGEFSGHVGILEFRAVIVALEYLQRVNVHSAVIHIDSLDAYRVIEELVRTGRYVDGYCGISEELCREFMTVWQACSASIEIVRHRGHAGLIYNEAADELAWIARVAAWHPRESAEGELLERIQSIQQWIQEPSQKTFISS